MWKWRSTYSRSLWDNEGVKRWKKFNWKKRQLPVSKNTRSCFASSIEPETTPLGNFFHGAQDSHQKQKGSETGAVVSFPSMEEDLCTKSEYSKETASALTTIAVTTSHHTGNWPGAPELKTQPYSWTYKSSALKGSNRLASLEVRHRGKHVKTPWSTRLYYH